MPGHMLAAECTCGFGSSVLPGVSERRGMAHMVIAYDSDAGRLVTLPEEEAAKRGLSMFENPFLNQGGGARRPPEVVAFPCPKCGERELRFRLEGFWD